MSKVFQRDLVYGAAFIEREPYFDEGNRTFYVRDVCTRGKGPGKLYRLTHLSKNGYVSMIFSNVSQVNKHFKPSIDADAKAKGREESIRHAKEE